MGLTPSGKEVWSTMEFDRSSKVLSLNLGKGFSDLYHEVHFCHRLGCKENFLNLSRKI